MTTTTPDNVVQAMDIIINQSLGEHIVYKPFLSKITGSITSSILLERIRYYWKMKGNKELYKFNKPCTHPLYREGDSWEEELGFTRSEFEGARKRIATRIKQGDSKTEAFEIFNEDGSFKSVNHIVIYWRDSDNVMWYDFNETLFKIHLLKQANAEITHSEILHYLRMQNINITHVMQNTCDTLLTDETHSVSLTTENTVVSLRKTFSLFLIYSGLLKPKAEIVKKAEAHINSIEEKPDNISSEEDDDNLPDKNIEAETSAKLLNNQYQEVVRRAFGQPGQPLNAGSFVGIYVNFFRGTFDENKKGVGKAKMTYQLKDYPMNPAQIAGLSLWYRKIRQDKLPSTMETLRRRCDEFQALPDFDTWVAEGQKRLDAIMANTESAQLEPTNTTDFDNTRKPTAEDYAVDNDVDYTSFNQEALDEILESLK